MPTKVTKRSLATTWNVQSVDVFGNPRFITHVGPTYTWDDTRSGSSCPSYRDKLRYGQDATTNYSVTATSRESTPGFAQVLRSQNIFGNPKDVIHRVEGAYAPFLDPEGSSADIVSRAINDATIGFLLKAKRVQTKFRGLTFLGELRKTLQLVRRPAESFRRWIDVGLHQYLRGAHGSRRQREKWVRRTWLELQFGLVPIMIDAKEAAEALSEQLNKFRSNQEIVSYAITREEPYGPTHAQNDTYTPSPSIIYHRLTSRQRCKISVRCVGAVSVSNYNGAATFDPRLWGFDPREFVPTLWELLPWSWAIDYISNVGNVLDARSFGLSELAWSSRTYKVEAERICTLSFNHEACTAFLSGYKNGTGSTSSSTVRYFELGRTRIEKPPNFAWNFGFPGIKKSMNLASALSLNQRVVTKLTTF